jgi:hypothetical protein
MIEFAQVVWFVYEGGIWWIGCSANSVKARNCRSGAPPGGRVGSRPRAPHNLDRDALPDPARLAHDDTHLRKRNHQVTTVRQDDAQATRTRNALVDTLVENGTITAEAVQWAFRAVPRHLFVADGTPLEVAYNVDEPVAIKRDADGVIISSTR